jgi:hypothetical protein
MNLEGVTLDVKSKINGFDVTGYLSAKIETRYVYTGQIAKVIIQFTPRTIQSRRIDGNMLTIEAPGGYIFPEKCIGMSLNILSSSFTGYGVMAGFPPDGVDCRGYKNETLEITFPQGSGLHVYDYELRVQVINSQVPTSDESRPNVWKIMTSSIIGTERHIIDYNATVAGYNISKLTRY